MYFIQTKLVLVLLLVFKIVLSLSSSDLFKLPEVPDVKKIENINFLEKTIESKLKTIKNEELALSYIQEIVGSWSYYENSINEAVLIDKIANAIALKIEPAVNIIKEICSFLTNKEHKQTIFYSLLNPCPNDDNIEVKINHFYNEIHNISSEVNFDILNDRNLIFHNYLIENIGKADHSWLAQRQYFLSTSDQARIENCNYVPDDPHFTKLYVSAIKNKHVLLLIDQTSEQMDITRMVAKTVITSLDENDKVSIILIADNITMFTRTDACNNDDDIMMPATQNAKQSIFDFLDNTNRTNGICNHPLGFQKSFEVLDKLYKSVNTTDMLPISFLYISEGITALFSDARSALSEITIGQSRLPHPVVINTCRITMNNRQIPYQSQFLQDIASQDFQKYSIDTSSWWRKKGDRSLIGKMLLMNKTMETLSKVPISLITELFNYKNFIRNQITLHPPVYDADSSNDFIVSLTKNCDKRGIFGIDFYLNYLVEDVIHSDQMNYSYKFLTDINGFTYAHSLLYPRPITLKETFQPVRINLLETNKGFKDIWNIMKKQKNGNAKLDNFMYTWRHISDLMIVCIVTNLDQKRSPVLQKLKPPGVQIGDQIKHLPELIYHRLDLLIPPNLINMCHYYKQVVTFDAITLMLSSRAFTSPYSHMKSNRLDDNDDSQTQTVQNFMAYLKDTRNLFANPGLLNEIKNEVTGIYQIMEHLKKKHLESDLRKYILRRYVSSMNGVLQVFPGCSMDVNYDATRRPWFIKAMEMPGKIVVTEPYLDAGGAGYIISMSYIIYEGQNAIGTRNKRSQPVAVVSIDFTKGFFYKMLLDIYPKCMEENIQCFLMDDKGYLIAHPSVLEPINDNQRQPEHITHKESHVANDILMHKNFVKKISCNNYLNGTSQRFYEFNTSISEVVTNFASVEKTKYQIKNVKSSNLFIGIINSTTETSGAFCPCSTIDFRCLNCYRMEQIECECPCECQLNDENCVTMKNQTSESRTCPQQVEHITSYQAPTVKEIVDSCNLFNCDMFAEKQDCLGIIGCIW